MIHYTFNTNHSFDCRNKEFYPETLNMLKPIVKKALESRRFVSLPSGFDEYKVTCMLNEEGGSCMFDIYYKDYPLFTNGLCIQEKAIESVLDFFTKMHKSFCKAQSEISNLWNIPEAPTLKAEVPVLITYIHRNAVPHSEPTAWIADFEQCYAKAILDLVNSSMH